MCVHDMHYQGVHEKESVWIEYYELGEDAGRIADFTVDLRIENEWINCSYQGEELW
jgi:hypothetical protein